MAIYWTDQQEMDMIHLFGSPAGRAINEITSIKLNRSEQEAAQLNQSRNGSNGERQKTTIVRNDFIQLNLTKFSQSSPNINERRDKHATATPALSNSNLLAKKIKFWKYFEDNNNNNEASNVENASNNSRNNDVKK